MKADSTFFGYTTIDGARTHDSPSTWVFGTIGPVSEYSFRYAPDSAVYEKQPKERKVKVEAVEAVEAIETPIGLSVFSAMTSFLTTLGDKS